MTKKKKHTHKKRKHLWNTVFKEIEHWRAQASIRERKATGSFPAAVREERRAIRQAPGLRRRGWARCSQGGWNSQQKAAENLMLGGKPTVPESPQWETCYAQAHSESELTTQGKETHLTGLERQRAAHPAPGQGTPLQTRRETSARAPRAGVREEPCSAARAVSSTGCSSPA